MAGTLVFMRADVLPLARHSLDCTEWVSDGRGGPAAPSLILVGDQGVYLVSGGKPGLRRGDGKGLAVAYAKGLQPHVDAFDHWFDAKVSITGGDDFAEVLPWARAILSQIEAGAEEIRIKITEDSMTLMELPKAPVRRSVGARA